MPHGVGIVGAGPGVAALHLPTLARLSDDFEVVHISDAGSGRAEDLAGACGRTLVFGHRRTARRSERVEVVVLASPPAEHAARSCASVAAGKRAILCEKPLATTVADADGGDRRVPRGRHGAPDRHQPSLRPGLGPREASPARRRPQSARDLGHPGAPAQWPLPRRRHRAAGARRRTRARRPAPRCAAGRGIRRPSADHGTRRARTADAARPRADRSSESCSRARSPRSAMCWATAHRGSRCGWPPSCFPTAPTRYGTSRSRPTPTWSTVSFPPAFVHIGSAEVRVVTATGKRHDLPDRRRPTATSPSGVRSPTC